MDAFVGMWEYKSGENEDALAEVMAIPAQIRERMKAIRPKFELARQGDAWIYTIFNPIEVTNQFTPGVPFERNTPTGQVVKVTAVFDGDKLLEDHEFVGTDRQMHMERTIVDNNEMIVVTSMKNVSSTTRLTRV